VPTSVVLRRYTLVHLLIFPRYLCLRLKLHFGINDSNSESMTIIAASTAKPGFTEMEEAISAAFVVRYVVKILALYNAEISIAHSTLQS
jgi:hypothetical protein